MITQQELKEFLHYDQDTGIFTWIKTSSKSIKIGYIAGYLHKDGYFRIRLHGNKYLAHRLAWLYVHGYMPDCIDHINNTKNDNRISNLRQATAFENACNRKKASHNTSGIKGVHWCKKDKKWIARINVNNKRIVLGYFNNLEFAELVINEARQKYHGEYANNG
jgi:hypothetical protein